MSPAIWHPKWNPEVEKKEGILMKLLDDVLNSLDFDAEITDIRQGVFHTAVVSRNCGLASTLVHEACHGNGPQIQEPGKLKQKTARDLASMAYSSRTMEASIGMAAINSLNRFNEDDCIQVNAAYILAEKGRGKNVAIIGHFPFVDSLREKVGCLWIIEKNRREGDLAETEAEDILPRADVVGITGTAITNHTIEDLLRLCRKDSFVLMLGDTTPMMPVLFERGIDAICGVKVIDQELVLNCVSQGANFRQIRGLRLLTMFRD
jgi:uncharacterized protein (DUF4213/DUF364 family)